MARAKWHGPYLLAVVALALVALSPRPGLTWDEPGYLAQGPGNVSAIAAARLASALLFALLVALTAHATYRAFGETAPWLAGGSLLLTPQVVAHAQLAALDLPMALAWMAAAAASFAGPTGWLGAVGRWEIDYVRALQDAGLLPHGAIPAPEDRCDVLSVLGLKSMLKGEFSERFATSPSLAETRRGGVVLAKLVSGDLTKAHDRGSLSETTRID